MNTPLSPEEVKAGFYRVLNSSPDASVTNQKFTGLLVGEMDTALASGIVTEKAEARRRRLVVLSYLVGRRLETSKDITPQEWYAIGRWYGREGKRDTWEREVLWIYAIASKAEYVEQGQVEFDTTPPPAEPEDPPATALPNWFAGPDDQADLDKATEIAPHFFAMMNGLGQNAESLETVFHMAFTMGARWQRWQIEYAKRGE